MLSTLTYAGRSLARDGRFASLAIITLALSIGTSTTVFSLADGVLFRSLPFSHPASLALVTGIGSKGRQLATVAPEMFALVQDTRLGFDSSTYLESSEEVLWYGDRGTQTITTVDVAPNLLAVLGVRPFLGTSFGASRTAHHEAVATFTAWQRRFNRDPTIVGRVLNLEGRTVLITGVLPQTFMSPVASARGAELLIAVHREQDGTLVSRRMPCPIVRLGSAVSLRQAQARLTAAIASLNKGTSARESLLLVPLQESLLRDVRPNMLLLTALSGCLVLLGCVAVAGLMTSRFTAHRHQLAIRMSLGATITVLLRNVLAESLLLAAVAGVAAYVVAMWAADGMSLLIPAQYLQQIPAPVRLRAVIYAVLTTLLCSALLTTVGYGWLRHAMSSSSLHSHGRTAPLRTRSAEWSALVSVQVALVLFLMVVAGAAAEQLHARVSAPLGYVPGKIVIVTFRFPNDYLVTPQARADFYARVRDHLVPLVGSDGMSAMSPFALTNVRPMAPLAKGLTQGGTWIAGPHLFAVLGVRMLAGRDITQAENDSAAPVVVINASARHLMWPDRDPVGQWLYTVGEPVPMRQVVGVVDNIRSGYGAAVEPAAYRPPLPTDRWDMTVVLRGRNASTHHLAEEVNKALRLFDSRVVTSARPLTDILEAVLGEDRTRMLISLFMAVMSSAVAMMSIYSAVNFSMSRRVPEIAVRFALGGSRRQVLMWAVKNPLMSIGVGLGAGLFVTVVASAAFGGGEYAPDSPSLLVYTASVVLLASAGVFALYWPARSVTHVDVVQALRRV